MLSPRKDQTRVLVPIDGSDHEIEEILQPLVNES